MDSFAEQLPLIIEKSAQSPLSLLALIIVALSGMAILLFRNASEQAKMRIFMSLSARHSVAGISNSVFSEHNRIDRGCPRRCGCRC